MQGGDVMGQRTPSLDEVILAGVDSRLADVQTAIPAKVESYDASNQTATVLPMVKLVQADQDGREIVDELGQVFRVPIVFPRGGGFRVTWPLSPGDGVLLVVAKPSLDQWQSSDGNRPVRPLDVRQFDLSNAVAVPGLNPLSKAVEAPSETTLELGDDSITIKVGEGKVVIGDGSKSALIAEEIQALWSSLKAALDAFGIHTHASNGAPPVPTMTTPTFPASAISTKVKIPNG